MSWDMIMDSEELFYQTTLFHFGCFYPITFTDSLCVTDLIGEVAEQKGVSLKKELDTLKSFACMLDDYFAIKFVEKEEKLFLQTLPMLLTEYQPNYAYLPIFLYRLATEVNYSEESRCLEGIAREIARFYSFTRMRNKKSNVRNGRVLFNVRCIQMCENYSFFQIGYGTMELFN